MTGAVGLALGCPMHNLCMEELGLVQPFPTTCVPCQQQKSTAYSAQFGDLQGRKGSAERHNHGCGGHLRQPNALSAFCSCQRTSLQECTRCLTLGFPCQCVFASSPDFISFEIFALTLKSPFTESVSTNFIWKFPITCYKNITTLSLNSYKG